MTLLSTFARQVMPQPCRQNLVTNYSGSSVNTPASFRALVEDQFECVSNMEENLLGHSPLDSNKLDHMVTSNSDPTLSGAHSHLTRHIQGPDFEITKHIICCIFLDFKMINQNARD